MSRRLPVVAVVGRPNVGKSTFFNRVLGHRAAIVDDRPGVTRDRNFAHADWAGAEFFLVDTGGVIEGSDEPLERLVRDQALAAVDEADLVLLMVDGNEGVHPLDERLSDVVRDSGRSIIVVANKIDNLATDQAHHDFWRLGLGEPVPVSAISGKGSGDLLDLVVSKLPTAPGGEEEADLRVAVLGRPNVGKSSFVNRLFGEERVVVTDTPGTTRDPVDSVLPYHGQRLVFVDTAGLRRHSRVQESIEYYSALRTHRVIREADVCLVLIEAPEGLLNQDLKILEAAWDAGCGVVLGINKWDLVEKDHRSAPEFEKTICARAPFLEGIPLLFLSAITGQRVRKSLDLLLEVAEERRKRVSTPEVNEVLERLVRRQPPPHSRGRQVGLRYATQGEIEPPTFLIFSNLPREVPTHYVRFLQNGFRAAWGFRGSPIRIRLRESKSKRGRAS